MKKRFAGSKLSRKKGARLALVKSLAEALILRERIKTTKARAKFTQKFIEKLIKLTKANSLSANRVIFSKLSDKKAAKKLITEIGPKFAAINSGFTKIVNLGQRRGDSASLALLEFTYIGEVQEEKKKELKEVKEQKEPKR